MSKWHRVELNGDQFKRRCQEWCEDDNLEGKREPCKENRIKLSSYHRFVNAYGVVTTGSAIPDRAYQSDDIIRVYKFKNEIEAMAFKLRWT